MAKKKVEKVEKSKNKMIVALLLDESGSMQSIQKPALSAVNEYIKSLKKDYEDKPELGEIYLSFITFSKKYGAGQEDVKFIYNLTNITEVNEIPAKLYKPDGGTPLLEAIGKTIESLDTVESRNPSAGNPLASFLAGSTGDCKVMVVIQTDGEENGWNPEYPKTKIEELIKEREAKGNWTFLFLGAGIDAIQEGMNVGVGVNSSYSFTGAASGKGSYGATYSAVTGASIGLRAAKSMQVNNIADTVSKLVSEEEEI